MTNSAPYSNAYAQMLPNPFAAVQSLGQMRSALALNQIQGFEPVQSFKDESNTSWVLVKEASNSTIDIPDPKSLQIVDYWNHEFPGLKSKLYIYVVEGIKQPRVETEQPTRIMYQWFSTVFVPTFTPQMISEREWLKANVYAAPVLNARVSKLKALCKITDAPKPEPAQDERLLQVDGITPEAQG